MFACFTVVNFRENLSSEVMRSLMIMTCVAENSLHLSRSFRVVVVVVFGVFCLFICLDGVIRSSKEKKNFVLLCPAFLNITCL